jgi:superfamily II DNA or RNA helicase
VNARTIPPGWTAWLSLDALDARIGTHALNQLLGTATPEYLVPPRLGGDGWVVAQLDSGHGLNPLFARRDPCAVALRPSLEHHRLETSCSCQIARWQNGPCAHIVRLLVDLAVHPPLAEAVLGGGAVRERMAELPQARARAHAERTAMATFARWIVPGGAEPIEISVEPALEHTFQPETVLIVRVRRVGERALVPAHEIATLPMAASDRRLLALTEVSSSSRKAMVARGPLASMLLHELSPRGSVWLVQFRKRAAFAQDPLRPRVVAGMAPPPARRESAPRASSDGTPRHVEVLTVEWASEDANTTVAAPDALLFQGPRPFLWDRRRETFHPVPADVDLAAAARLQSQPVIELPRAHRERIGRMLHAGMRGRGIALPARETLGLPRLETPALVLRMTGGALDLTGRLEAVYASRTVALPADAPAETDERDLDTEAAALALVRRGGLEVRADEASGEPRLCAEAEGAIDFWQRGILELRAADAPRIEVLLSEPLARVRVGAPLRARVHIALEGGWLDAHVDFDSDEVAVEMASVRAALARGARWVTLSDGTLARIHDGVAALAADAVEVLDGKNAGRVPAHQLGRLSRWVDEHGGTVDAAIGAFRARLRALGVSGEPALPEMLTATLRPYQRQGVAWLQFLGELGAGGILADDMGLGKTLMTLAFLAREKEEHGPAPSLVVCPTSVAHGWVREAARFTPDLRVLLFHGSERDAAAIRESDLVVTTYAILRRDIDVLEKVPFRAVVADEAQNIKNADAATTLAAKRLQSPVRLALSGTPVENRLRELWSILDFVNPGMLSSARAFESRFERPIVAAPGGSAAADLRAVVRPFLLRRTKAEVLVDLPPKTEIERACVLAPAQKRLYDALALTLRQNVEQKIAEVGIERAGLNVLTALLRLRQMACDPRLVDPVSRTPSAKRAAFLEIVRELVAEGRRALVFSQFVELLRLWRADLDAEGIAYEYLDGSTTDREAVVDRFQRGHSPLFLVSLKAGGSGLNLTAADTVIHCDPWWNPAVEDQATDRAHRIGQERPVTVVRLVAKGTVEEKIGALKAAKRQLADVIIGSGAGALRGLTEDDVRSLLGDSGESADAENADGESADGEAGDEEPGARPAIVLPAGPARGGESDLERLRAAARRWLAQPGRSQTMFGERVGMPQTAVSRFVRGAPMSLKAEVAERIRKLDRAH